MSSWGGFGEVGARARRPWAVVAAGVLVAVVVSGCGDDASGESGARPASSLVEGVVVDVAALDNRFEPEELTVAPGTELRFTNDGRNDHNVLPTSESDFDARIDTADLEPGEAATIRLTELGTYSYFCSIHGTQYEGMVGSIVVEE